MKVWKKVFVTVQDFNIIISEKERDLTVTKCIASLK